MCTIKCADGAVTRIFNVHMIVLCMVLTYQYTTHQYFEPPPSRRQSFETPRRILQVQRPTTIPSGNCRERILFQQWCDCKVIILLSYFNHYEKRRVSARLDSQPIHPALPKLSGPQTSKLNWTKHAPYQSWCWQFFAACLSPSSSFHVCVAPFELPTRQYRRPC